MVKIITTDEHPSQRLIATLKRIEEVSNSRAQPYQSRRSDGDYIVVSRPDSDSTNDDAIPK